MSFSRRLRRRRYRGRLRFAGVVDFAEAERRLGGCRCPALITSGAGMVTVEHYHVAHCPALQEREEAAS